MERGRGRGRGRGQLFRGRDRGQGQVFWPRGRGLNKDLTSLEFLGVCFYFLYIYHRACLYHVSSEDVRKQTVIRRILGICGRTADQTCNLLQCNKTTSTCCTFKCNTLHVAVDKLHKVEHVQLFCNLLRRLSTRCTCMDACATKSRRRLVVVACLNGA